MKQVNALNMNYNEFREIVNKATNNGADFILEEGSWCFGINNEMNAYDNDSEIIDDIEKYLKVNIIDIIINTIVCDDDYDGVVIITK